MEKKAFGFMSATNIALDSWVREANENNSGLDPVWGGVSTNWDQLVC